LAAGVPRSFDSANDLRIASGQANPAPANGLPQGTVTGMEREGAVLRPPQAVLDPASRPGAPVAPATPVSGGRGGSYEQLQTQLAARGVTWQRLECTGENEDWKFSCSVPNRQNPNLRRTYEAHAREALAAIQAVLDQMDKDKN
jgi:hypothetical protein